MTTRMSIIAMEKPASTAWRVATTGPTSQLSCCAAYSNTDP